MKIKGKQAILEVSRNGPYMVKNLKILKNTKGEEIPTEPLMALCRCGHSSTKPFCDGTHIEVEFDGGKDESRVEDKVDVYEGKDITIYDNRGVCSHRGYCSEALPAVFGRDKEPWINPDGASADEIIIVCQKCPSGALSFGLPGEERIQDVAGREEEIALAPLRYETHGPYDVSGEIPLMDEDGTVPESKEHYTLCRCGASKNKPFCTGEHWRIKFIDEDN